MKETLYTPELLLKPILTSSQRQGRVLHEPHTELAHLHPMISGIEIDSLMQIPSGDTGRVFNDTKGIEGLREVKE